MSDGKVLVVRLNGRCLGVLEQTATGRMAFSYAEGADRALSLSMPVRSQPYDDDACEAYFGGLLPESDAARKAVARYHGANANNAFSLLRALGHDCAGALSLHPPDGDASEAPGAPLAGRILSDAELATHLRDLPKRPLFVGVDGIRLALAGAQDKAALCLIDGKLAAPVPGIPTTHILKPAIAAVGDTVSNEYLCMRLAAAVGLKVAAVEMRQVEGIPFLLVERFDRTVDGGLVHRIHQEDFCQALGVRSPQKYERDGGPGLTACFDLTKRLAVPAKARTMLLDTLVFNVLIGNGDAHAKNHSLLHPEGAKPMLAPGYDLLSTRYHFERRSRMAMKLGGHYEFERIRQRHWQRLARDTGLAFPLVRTTIEAMEAKLRAAIASERARHDAEEAHRLLDYVSAHARTMAGQAR